MAPETAAALAVEPNPQPAQPTPAEMHANLHMMFTDRFAQLGNVERLKSAHARGLFKDPSVIPTPEELRAAVPLEGDTMRYAKDRDGNPRMASDIHGMPSFPKPRGRKNARMTKRMQAVKSGAIALFRGMFTKEGHKLEAVAQAKGEQFLGIPNEQMPVIGARATRQAARQYIEKIKADKRRKRNRQKLSRRINRGVVPGNTNVRAYITN